MSVEEATPGRRIQCRVFGERLIVEIAPGPIVLSPDSLGCLVLSSFSLSIWHSDLPLKR